MLEWLQEVGPFLLISVGGWGLVGWCAWHGWRKESVPAVEVESELVVWGENIEMEV